MSYPVAYYPADWLDFDWYAAKWEVSALTMVQQSAGTFISWHAYWLQPARVE